MTLNLTVSHELREILTKYGCSQTFYRVIHSFHDGQNLLKVAVCETSSASNGMNQGCVLTPALFSLVLATMLFAVLLWSNMGVKICCKLEDFLFDLHCLEEEMKEFET